MLPSSKGLLTLAGLTRSISSLWSIVSSTTQSRVQHAEALCATKAFQNAASESSKRQASAKIR